MQPAELPSLHLPAALLVLPTQGERQYRASLGEVAPSSGTAENEAGHHGADEVFP